MRWPKFKVGDITHAVTKGTTPTKDQGFAESGVNFIKAEALNGDSALDHKGIFHISEDVHQKLKRSILQEDDVLLTIAGVQIGKCGLVRPSHLPANTNQAVGIMRVDPSKAHSRYVYYWFKQRRTFAFVQGLNAQAAQPNINLSMLKNIEIPLPRMVEQRAITAILSTYDDLIENNRRRIQLLEQAARLLYKEWFVHLRFPGHEHVTISDGVPAGWEKKHLSELLNTQYGFTETATDEPVGPQFLRGTDINKTSYIDWSTVPYCSDDKLDFRKYALRIDDIVVIRMADPGKVAIVESEVKAVFASYLVRLTRKQGVSIPALYLFYVLSDDLYQGFISGASGGSTRKSASAKLLVNFNALVPPSSLASMFVEQVRPLRNQICTLLEQNANLREARDLLLPRLMSGEVAV